MNYLVDTHILLWSFIEPKKLTENIRRILLDEDNTIFYSPINLWEISIKYGLKKLRLNNMTPEEFFWEVENSYWTCSTTRLVVSQVLWFFRLKPCKTTFSAEVVRKLEVSKQLYYVCKRIDNLNIITNYKLPMLHKDPFDRFLVWESIRNDFILLSIDKTLTQYKKDGLKIMF